MTKDMTSGSTLRHIINFAVPLCMGMLFQQLYSMVDTMIVGKVLGVQPLAGVGATGSLNFMIIWFCIGICNGFSIPIAQAFAECFTDGMSSCGTGRYHVKTFSL